MSGRRRGGDLVDGGDIEGGRAFLDTDVGRSRGVPGNTGSGEMKHDWFAHSYTLWMEWLNNIDDFITNDESYMMRSPYATFGEAEAISGISTASPCVLTITGTSLVNGDRILVVGTGAYHTIGVAGTTIPIDTYASVDPSSLPRPAQGKLDGHIFTVRNKATNTVELEGFSTVGWSNTPSVGFAYKITLKTGFDPTADTTAIKTELDTYQTAVAAIDGDGASGDYNKAVTRVVAEAGNLYTTAYIDSVVEAFEARLDSVYSLRTRRFAAGMATAGAQNATGFSIGLALIESEKRREVYDFHAQVVLNIENVKSNAMLNGISEIMAMTKFEVEEKKASAQLHGEFYRLSMALKAQKEDADRALEKKDHTWPVDRFAYGANMFAVQSGAVLPTPSEEPVVKGGGVGGAMVGMAVGGFIGSSIIPTAMTVLNPVVAGIGAILGAVAGYQP